MSRLIDADYSQTLLFPPRLEEWVPADHPARFLREFADALDLEKLGFRMPANDAAGRPAYAPSLLLKVWLHGYMNRLYSSRKLEWACREHLSLIWLTGNHPPDHNTLWRFFNTNRKALKMLFRKCVQISAEAGLVSVALHAVDGTKMAAAASNRSVWKREELKELLERLDASVEAAEQAVDQAEQTESGSYRLPEALVEREALRKRVKEALEKNPESKAVSMSEPESRVLPVDGRKRPGYNAQAVAEEKNGLIVAAEVAEETNDTHQLTPMLDEVEANLGSVASETVADAGYVHGPSLAEAEEKGRAVTVSLKGKDDRLRSPDDRYHRSHFVYDEKADQYVCPEGKRLDFQRTTPNAQETYSLRVYHCRAYRTCEKRWECSANQRGRTVKRNPYEETFTAMREKTRSPEGRARLRRRKVIVEPVFGVIKEAMGFRRFTVWGRESVRAQWALVATAYNLKKMMKRWLEGEFKWA